MHGNIILSFLSVVGPVECKNLFEPSFIFFEPSFIFLLYLSRLQTAFSFILQFGLLCPIFFPIKYIVIERETRKKKLLVNNWKWDVDEYYEMEPL